MMGLSLPQILIIVLIIVLLFGTKKLRNMGKDLGGAVKDFKSAVNEEENKKEEQPKQLENQEADANFAELNKEKDKEKSE